LEELPDEVELEEAAWWRTAKNLADEYSERPFVQKSKRRLEEARGLQQNNQGVKSLAVISAEEHRRHFLVYERCESTRPSPNVHEEWR